MYVSANSKTHQETREPIPLLFRINLKHMRGCFTLFCLLWGGWTLGWGVGGGQGVGGADSGGRGGVLLAGETSAEVREGCRPEGWWWWWSCWWGGGMKLKATSPSVLREMVDLSLIMYFSNRNPSKYAQTAGIKLRDLQGGWGEGSSDEGGGWWWGGGWGVEA